MHFSQIILPLAVSLSSLSSNAFAESCIVSNKVCGTETKTDPPKNPKCGIYGKPTRGMQKTTCKAMSFSNCRDACLDDKSCGSFGYTAKTSSCVFSKDGLEKHLFKNPNTDFGSVYYNRHCFQRSCFSSCTTNSDSTQMVDDPSFKNDFKDWNIASTGNHKPEISKLYAPHGNPQAYWVSTDKDKTGSYATISQRLQRNGTDPQPFKFSAWFGQYSDGGYAPMSATVTLDDEIVFSTDRICTTDTVCQDFGDATTYRKVSASGVMSGSEPLLVITFAPTRIEEYQVGYVSEVKIKTKSCDKD